jgi:hypothetical protein
MTSTAVQRKAISSPKTHVVEFDITGGWFGSRWGRDRHFAWVIYVALTTEGRLAATCGPARSCHHPSGKPHHAASIACAAAIRRCR